jgi:chromosome partitioning protein
MKQTTIGFISEKGGVGKTTVCFHVAIALSREPHNKRVLVVDMDYQRGGITGRFDYSLLEKFKSGAIKDVTLYQTFRALYAGIPAPTPKPRTTAYNGLNLIPGDPRMTEISIDKLPGSNNIRENNLKLFQHLSAIRDSLAAIENPYDFILIDTHPETSELLRSVIYACDYCVSPVKLDEQSSVGVPSAIEAINGVNNDVNTLTHLVGIIPKPSPTLFKGAIGCMTREWGGTLKWTESVQYSRLRKSSDIFDAYITEGDGLRQAAANRCPVFDITGQNAQKQSRQLTDLTDELLRKCP